MRLAPIAVVAAVLAGAGCASEKTVSEQRRIAAKLEAGAEAAPAGTFSSLSGLVRHALDLRPSMAAARIEVADARLAMKEIDSDAPVVSSMPWNAVDAGVSAGYSESSRAAHSGDFKMKTRKGSVGANLSLDLLVFDFGRHGARRRAQAERVVAAEQALGREGFVVCDEVSQAWWNLVQCIELEKVARTNIVQREAHLEQAENRFEAGEAQRLDVLTARLGVAEAREAAVAASNDVAVAAVGLGYAAALPASAVSVPADAFPAAGAERPAEPSADGAAAEPQEWGAQPLFDFAATNSPAVLAAKARVRAASAQVDYAVADMRPSLSANVSLNWTDPLWYWRWGVDAAQTLFAGWRKKTAVDRAVAALRKSETDFDAALQALRRDIEAAAAERDNADEAARTARESLRQARENLETANAQYETGDASRVDVADASAAYAAAAAATVKAACRSEKARAAICALAGIEPPFARRQEGEDR